MAFKKGRDEFYSFWWMFFLLRLFDRNFLLKNYVFIILFLAAHGLSVGAASRGCFLVAERGLLILEAPLLVASRSCGLQ